MKILVNGVETEVLVSVPIDRKCAASMDIVDNAEAPHKLARLSFGDLDAPKVDVEVDFTLEQLTGLIQVATLGYNGLETAIEKCKKKQLEKEEAERRKRESKRPTSTHHTTTHFGHC